MNPGVETEARHMNAAQSMKLLLGTDLLDKRAELTLIELKQYRRERSRQTRPASSGASGFLIRRLLVIRRVAVAG